QGLGRHAQGGARQTPEKAEGQYLDQIGDEEDARARPEALEDRDRHELAPEEGGHRGRDPDAADQQARQPDEAEVGGELREEAAQARLSLVERRDADRRIADRAGEIGAGDAGRHAGGEARERSVTDTTANLQESGPLE